MLILRRKAGESLQIGDEIILTVMDVYEGGVRLAIDAPRRIPVLRTELVLAAEANRDAAQEQAQPEALLQMLGGLPAAAPVSGGTAGESVEQGEQKE